MGLITKEVEVRVRGFKTKYYKDLGYEIPLKMNNYGKMVIDQNAKIWINVNDLPLGSGQLVEIECDGCHNIFQRQYYYYNKYNHDGKYYCAHCIGKELLSGEKHWNWDDTKTDEERRNGRAYPEYKDFTKRVMARDNYTCQCCGQEHGDIEVHHLDGYSWCIEKRLDDTNGITLCRNCHSNFHARYGNKHNTKEEFEEWFGKALTDLKKYDGKLTMARKVYCIDDDVTYNSANEYAEMNNAHISMVYACCNHKIKKRKVMDKKGNINIQKSRTKSVKGKHLLWLDEYNNMTSEDIENYLKTLGLPIEEQNKILNRNKDLSNNDRSFII